MQLSKEVGVFISSYIFACYVSITFMYFVTATSSKPSPHLLSGALNSQGGDEMGEEAIYVP